MLNINIRYRGKKYLPLTTDDITELNSYKNNDNVLKLIHENKKHWTLLEDINTLICNETTNFILQNKPVFDKEKLKLIKIDLLINKILDFGLKYSFENNNESIVLYNQNTNDHYKLDVNTFNNSWNNNSEKINTLIKNIINEYKKEHTIINVINDSIVNNTNIRENRKWIKYVIIFIMLLSPIIYYYYYY